MLKLPSSVEIYKKKSIQLNLLVLSLKEHKVYQLVNDLYGLKQAHRAWYAKMDDNFKKWDFNEVNQVLLYMCIKKVTIW